MVTLGRISHERYNISRHTIYRLKAFFLLSQTLLPHQPSYSPIDYQQSIKQPHRTITPNDFVEQHTSSDQLYSKMASSDSEPTEYEGIKNGNTLEPLKNPTSITVKVGTGDPPNT